MATKSNSIEMLPQENPNPWITRKWVETHYLKHNTIYLLVVISGDRVAC